MQASDAGMEDWTEVNSEVRTTASASKDANCFSDMGILGLGDLDIREVGVVN